MRESEWWCSSDSLDIHIYIFFFGGGPQSPLISHTTIPTASVIVPLPRLYICRCSTNSPSPLYLQMQHELSLASISADAARTLPRLYICRCSTNSLISTQSTSIKTSLVETASAPLPLATTNSVRLLVCAALNRASEPQSLEVLV